MTAHTRIRTTRLFACLLVAALLAWSLPVMAEAALHPDLQPLPIDRPARYFGLYFQGHKVGWMSNRLHRPQPGALESLTALSFTLNVGGMETKMSSIDRRQFDPASGKLTLLDYSMTGATGETRVRGIVNGKQLTLVTLSGGGSQTQTLPDPGERLQDILATELAIRSGKATPGRESTSRSFDPSILRPITAHDKISGIESRPLHGVATKVVRVDGRIDEMGLALVSWYTEGGDLLETQIAGMLKAKWESETQAKSGLSVADFMETSLVRPPQPLSNAASAAQLRARVSGVPEKLRLTGERQAWRVVSGDTLEVVVTREAGLDGPTSIMADIDRTRFAAELAPTPRLQSDDPAIVKQAVELARGESQSGPLARKILNWVFRKVEKSYTPTFSNASEVMKTMEGDCGEHAVLFVALARAAGLPAREVAGIVYAPEMGGFGYHAWAEVWVGRWLSVDPSWGQIAVDVTHLAFARGGIAEQVRIISLIGQLKILDAQAGKIGVPK